MATESAPMRSRSAQNLWQLPMFLLGIASLIGVWYARPYLQPSPVQRYERDLSALRQVLEKSPYDRKQLEPLLKKIEGASSDHSINGSVAFLLGSVQVNLAETSENEEEAKKAWLAARQYFDSVGDSKLSDADTNKYQFRLGKVWANTGGVEPAKIIEQLTKHLQSGDDAAEGYRLLAGEYLKLQPPDQRKARDLLKEYLSRALPRTDPKILNRSRWQLGELQTQLGEVEEARKVLSRIGEDASQEIFVSAKLTLVRGYQAEEDWASAITALEEARKARGVSPSQQASIEYLLANSYLKVNRAADAIPLFEKVRKSTAENESQAAAIRLAELKLKDPKERENTVKSLETAVSKIASPEEYRNPLLSLNETRAIYELAVSQYRMEAEFPSALRVAKSFVNIGTPGRDRELTAEVLEAWGDALERQARTDESEGPKWKEAAQKKFREGATELETLLKEKKTAVEKAKVGTDLARMLTRAGEQEQARKVLQSLQINEQDTVRVPIPMVEGKEPDWLQKGESALAVGDRAKAIQAFETGSVTPGPQQFKCRYQLARLYLDGGTPEQFEPALKLLELNDDPEAEKDRETHEKSAYLMGFTLYARYDWLKAEYRLSRAIQFYPESTQSVKAHFYQGRCFWYLAAQKATRIKDLNVKIQELDTTVSGRGGAPTDNEARQKKQFQEQVTQEEKSYAEQLTKARPPFLDVEEKLLKKKQSESLNPEETKLLRQSSFAVAECAFYLGDYEDCVKRYEGLADRYQLQVEELMALSQLWQCYSVYLEEPKKADYVVSRMRTAYQKLTPNDFDNSIQERSQKFWEKWFQQVDVK